MEGEGMSGRFSAVESSLTCSIWNNCRHREMVLLVVDIVLFEIALHLQERTPVVIIVQAWLALP